MTTDGRAPKGCPPYQLGHQLVSLLEFLHGPNSSHVTKDCRVLNNNSRLSHQDKGKGAAPGWRSFNAAASSALTPSSAPSNLCRYCKKVPYTIGHRCPEGAARFATLKKTSLNALVIDPHPADLTLNDFDKPLTELDFQAQLDQDDAFLEE
ncbi:unnamed protein product [Absidia cylindrospora]